MEKVFITTVGSVITGVHKEMDKAVDEVQKVFTFHGQDLADLKDNKIVKAYNDRGMKEVFIQEKTVH